MTIGLTKPELVAPAGSREKLEYAIHYGADAVYLGLSRFGLRAGADNFEEEELAAAINYAHQHRVKVYAAFNAFMRNSDVDAVRFSLSIFAANAIDALIISDPGMLYCIRRYAPDLPVHLSTQANTLNWAAVRFWEEQGIKRIILGRELNWREIKRIRAETPIELEVFVHGAMCMAYSGRCWLSQHLAGRDANQGDCAHPCRWQYTLQEQKRPGMYFPVREDSQGTQILSSKDLCLIDQIPLLAECAVNGLKIEGRTKSVHYVATMVNAYRQALEDYWRDPGGWTLDSDIRQETGKINHRPYTTGFFAAAEPNTDCHLAPTVTPATSEFAGLVLKYEEDTGMALVEQRGKFMVGDQMEILSPGKIPFAFRVRAIQDEKGTLLSAAPHPQQRIVIPVPQPVAARDILRRMVN